MQDSSASLCGPCLWVMAANLQLDTSRASCNCGIDTRGNVVGGHGARHHSLKVGGTTGTACQPVWANIDTWMHYHNCHVAWLAALLSGALKASMPPCEFDSWWQHCRCCRSINIVATECTTAVVL